jgi:hypothetical protein
VYFEPIIRPCLGKRSLLWGESIVSGFKFASLAQLRTPTLDLPAGLCPFPFAKSFGVLSC